MKQKDILDEEWTPLKLISLLMCVGVLFIIGHYQYCHWRNGEKYTPRSCKIVTAIVNTVTGMK
ncbi:hypothetical protein [Wohlfahrtiimonas chitiniclastica]|uniref:hypothetical protein n=1 Tax=Wohlfahrtiimonas chitiniclastica TaxID=400946 RepID=UPI0007B69C81|nr:hypothetical protein [Wohlfahrtiimonas chitiniclastica]KZX38118.1 hypothetical protein A6V30_04345 [Wohlfahrtiimonas chitiniclastica]